MRTSDCDKAVRLGRLSKAEQFADAARTVRDLSAGDTDVADAYVTLCVHAGIAAADVICCARLARYSRGEDHNEAVTLLGTVDATAAKHLRSLLDMKTRAGYSHTPASVEQVKRAGRAMEALLTLAHRVA
ncbi:MAG: hypothetical protein JJE50_07080 [Actinomycetales bacterium]|nr:hypothetical protein [Actinomycetales bacterium]